MSAAQAAGRQVFTAAALLRGEGGGAQGSMWIISSETPYPAALALAATSVSYSMSSCTRKGQTPWGGVGGIAEAHDVEVRVRHAVADEELELRLGQVHVLRPDVHLGRHPELLFTPFP